MSVITFNQEINIGDKFYYNGKKNFLSEIVDILDCHSRKSGEITGQIYIAKAIGGLSTNSFEVGKVGIIRNRAIDTGGKE